MNRVTRITTEIEHLPRSTFVKATAELRDPMPEGTQRVVHRVRAQGPQADAEFQVLHELVRIVEGWADCRLGRLFADNALYLTPDLGELATVAQSLPGDDTADEEAVVFYSVPRRRLDPTKSATRLA